MSTLRINNIEAQSIPASPTIDEKVKVTNSSGDILVNIDGKTSGITTIGINTTDGNIKFDANSNVLITGILTATTLAGNFTPDSLEIGSNIKLGNTGVITATSFVGSGANLTSLPSQLTLSNNADNRVITGGSGVNLNGESNLTFNGSKLVNAGSQTLTAGTAPQYRLNASSADGSDNDRAILGLATANNHFINGTSAGDTILRTTNSGNLLFGVGTSEKLRIDSSGRLIQRYSAAPYDNRAATFQSPAGQAQTYIAVVNTETNGSSGILFGDHAGQNAGNFDGYINYSHQYQHMAFMVASGTERMRIDSNGYVTMPFRPAFKCHIATQASPNNGVVSENNGFTLNATSFRDAFNNGSHFSEATGKFTAPVTGLYFFHFSVMRYSNNGSGSMDLRIKKNASLILARSYRANYSTEGNFASMNVTTITNMTAGHNVTFVIGANMSVYEDDSYMLGYLLG